jgi:hypothetical protein
VREEGGCFWEGTGICKLGSWGWDAGAVYESVSLMLAQEFPLCTLRAAFSYGAAWSTWLCGGAYIALFSSWTRSRKRQSRSAQTTLTFKHDVVAERVYCSPGHPPHPSSPWQQSAYFVA